jgi:hypothetical protein
VALFGTITTPLPEGGELIAEGAADVMSGGRRGFAHRQKTPRNTSLVGWLRGDLLVDGVSIRKRFWLGLLGVEGGFGCDGFLRTTLGFGVQTLVDLPGEFFKKESACPESSCFLGLSRRTPVLSRRFGSRLSFMALYTL